MKKYDKNPPPKKIDYSPLNSNNSKKLHKHDDIYYPTACAVCELLPELLKYPIDPESLEPVYLRTDKYWEKK